MSVTVNNKWNEISTVATPATGDCRGGGGGGGGGGDDWSRSGSGCSCIGNY